jgi:hypothetical protein
LARVLVANVVCWRRWTMNLERLRAALWQRLRGDQAPYFEGVGFK